MKEFVCTIISNVEIVPGVSLVWIEAPHIAATAQPGQFVTLRCGDFTLRRPFSIHQVKSGRVSFLFKVVGKGTLWLSQCQKGDKIDILGPLGKGFSIEPGSRNLLLLAGGIGISPLVFLAQHAAVQHSVRLIYGASTARELCPVSPLPSGVQFVPVTEDGSMGRRGLVTDVLPDFLEWSDQLYACGPVGMYRAMSELACHSDAPGYCHSEAAEQPKNLTQGKAREESKLKKCQVSLEVRMGCGIGACYGCSINTKKGLKKVCQDGPVFELDDITWGEVKI